MEHHPGRVTGYPLVVPPISALEAERQYTRFMGRAGVWSNPTTTFDGHI